MKKIYLFAYQLVSSITAFAQISKEDFIKKDTVQRSNITVASASNISVLNPQLTSKSPNVGSFLGSSW